MKRIAFSVVLCLFLLAMLLPVTSSVNNSIVYPSVGAKALRADGSPGPPTPHPPTIKQAFA